MGSQPRPYARKPVYQHPWYYVREFAPGVFCIAEPSHVNSFLVLGRDAAALIDTGLAIADLHACVRQITPLPVIVVNTHYHGDHAGNNWRFADGEICIHTRGAEKLAHASDPEDDRRFLDYVLALLDAARAATPLDEVYFHLFEGASLPRALPSGFDPAQYTVRPTHATRLLKDGDTIDLGGRVLDVLHTPGHTPDSICLHDRQTGVLFGGDTINTGPVYAQGDDSDVPTFYESCVRLAERAGDFSKVAVAHFGRAATDADLILEHADGFEAVLDGTATWRTGRDYTGYVAEALFDRFSIFVPLHSPFVRWKQ